MMRRAVGIALIWVLVSAWPADGAWDGGGDGRNAAWFNSLKQPGTAISCCGTGDAFRVLSYRSEGGMYVARIQDGRLIEIPAERILRTANPVGDAVVFLQPGDSKVLCFVPAPEI